MSGCRGQREEWSSRGAGDPGEVSLRLAEGEKPEREKAELPLGGMWLCGQGSHVLLQGRHPWGPWSGSPGSRLVSQRWEEGLGAREGRCSAEGSGRAEQTFSPKARNQKQSHQGLGHSQAGLRQFCSDHTSLKKLYCALLNKLSRNAPIYTMLSV